MPTPDSKPVFRKYQGFIFDLDGTVYRGEQIIPGAADVINAIQEAGKSVMFVTNKTTGNTDEYYHFLLDSGVVLQHHQITNATMVTGQFLARKYLGQKFYAIAEPTFIAEIENLGLKYSENPAEVTILLITLDRFCTFQKLEIASKCLENGAKFFAANIDTTCPVEEGEIWDAGSTIAALEKRTHRKLELHFGKPSAFMIAAIQEYLQLPPEKLLIIGDRLETDILMGNHAGIDTALVPTGVKNFLNGDAVASPTYVLNSLKDLL